MPQIKLIAIKVKKDHLSPKRYKQALESAKDEAEIGVLDDYKKTTRTWTHQPKFYTVRARDTLTVFTDDKIYEYVSEGTKPHLIFPKRGKSLRFSANSKAKTRPRVITSSQGSRSGKVVFSKGVIHPGTTAREFHRIIAEKWIKKYPPIVNRHLKTASV